MKTLLVRKIGWTPSPSRGEPTLVGFSQPVPSLTGSKPEAVSGGESLLDACVTLNEAKWQPKDCGNEAPDCHKGTLLFPCVLVSMASALLTTTL